MIVANLDRSEGLGRDSDSIGGERHGSVSPIVEMHPRTTVTHKETGPPLPPA
jgi:hypothetical protein